MNDNFRRKDFSIPRSMKEAFGTDDTFEPEIRCCSELFYKRPSKPTAPFVSAILILIFFVAGVVSIFGH